MNEYQQQEKPRKKNGATVLELKRSDSTRKSYNVYSFLCMTIIKTKQQWESVRASKNEMKKETKLRNFLYIFPFNFAPRHTGGGYAGDEWRRKREQSPYKTKWKFCLWNFCGNFSFSFFSLFVFFTTHPKWTWNWLILWRRRRRRRTMKSSVKRQFILSAEFCFSFVCSSLSLSLSLSLPQSSFLSVSVFVLLGFFLNTFFSNKQMTP